MTNRTIVQGLQIDPVLNEFIDSSLLPDLGLSQDQFWKVFADMVANLGPKNKALLAKRDDLQEKIDAWHRDNRDAPANFEAYKAFLSEIGYLVPEGEDFQFPLLTSIPKYQPLRGRSWSFP